VLRLARDYFAHKKARPMADRLDARLRELEAQAQGGTATATA
jgi:hypothetical protein